MSVPSKKKELLGKLSRLPIVEAVVEIDCDMPPGLELASLEPEGLKRLGEGYPILQRHFLEQHRIEKSPSQKFSVSSNRGLQALRFLKSDKRELVQVRVSGYSFNKLAPYATLDEYLPEIERTYGLFRDLAGPVQVRKVTLRYINRIRLPLEDGVVEFNDYLEKSPHVPDDKRFHFLGFLHQDVFQNVKTRDHVTRILSIQPIEKQDLPLLFDITVSRQENLEPENWRQIRASIMALRSLKNEVFADTLTERCLNLFR